MKRFPLYAGTFLLAGSVLLLEVALTRVFAVLMWHHFAYMVVSLALVGFGAAGSFLAVRGRLPEEKRAMRSLATWASLSGVAVVLAFMVSTSIRVHSLEIWLHPSNFLGLAAIFLVLAVPFLLAGLAIGGAVSCFSGSIARVYGSDLVGSALGAALAPFILAALGASGTVMVAAAAALLGGAFFSLGQKPRLKLVHMAGALLGILLALGFGGGWAFVPALHWRIPFGPHKGIQALFPGMAPETTLYSSVAQVDISKPFESAMFIGGQFGDKDRENVVIRGVTQDGTAPTAIYAHGDRYPEMPALDDTQAASAYVAFAARGGSRPRVLVIGVGGGPDVMVALHAGAREVKAVEINQAMIRMVTKVYAAFLGPLFDDPRVTLIHEDGRSFARRDKSSFDIIQMSGVDTYTALSTGAYTLSESYLYTVEAIKDFYARLNPGGYINYSRFLLQAPKRPRETIRLANIARTALEELGIQEPYKQICVLEAHGWASTIIRKGPFQPVETQALRRFAREEHFMGLVADPDRPPGGPYAPGCWPDAAYLKETRKALERVESLLKLPETRSLPMSFRRPVEEALRAAVAGRLKRSDNLLKKLASPLPGPKQLSVLASLKATRDRFLQRFKQASAHFVRVQKDFDILLKSPEKERQDFVERYFYDLSPATDDKPFFFNYFRFDRFLNLTGKESWDATYLPNFPVGHMVLLSSLVQIMILAGLLIFWPLRKQRLRRTPRRQCLRVFAYFGALGMGFMFVEICLMQKFILFLGHPAYSLCVVLAGMLFFSGLGAMFTARFQKTGASLRTRLLLGVVGAILLEALLIGILPDRLLGLPFAGRVLATVLLLAPVGFLLGMPFPVGILSLREHTPALIPWAWAINGFLSVFSSLLAIVLAMAVGFNAVLLLGALIYALGLSLSTEPGSFHHDSKP